MKRINFTYTPLALALAGSLAAWGTATAGCGTPVVPNAPAVVKTGQPGAGSVIANGTVLLV